MVQLGHKPQGNAPGVGLLSAGRAKATVLGAFTKAVWVTEVGIRMGRTGGTIPLASACLWDVNSSDVPISLFYGPDPKTIDARMSGNDPATGISYAWHPAPGGDDALPGGLPIAARHRLAIGPWVDDSPGGEIAYGQDHSGERMYRDQSAPTPPDPFGVSFSSPEGRISGWIIATENVRPNTPTILRPRTGATIVDLNPEIAIQFSDPNESLGDYFAQYRIEIWDEAGSQRLRWSGVVDTDATEQGDNQAVWSPPRSLTPGVYRIRAWTYDHFGVMSQPAERTITINAGGAFEDIRVGPEAGTNDDGVMILSSGASSMAADWVHDEGVNLSSYVVQVRNRDTDAIVRGPVAVTSTVASGGSIGFLFSTPDPDWTDLPGGVTQYQWEIRGTDANGGVSEWTTSDPFIVNAPPDQPSGHDPAHGTTLATFPDFMVSITDVNDGSSDMGEVTVEFENTANPGVVTLTMEYADDPAFPTMWVESNNLMEQLAKSIYVIDEGHSEYRWRVVGTDVWGAAFDPPDTWHTFHYVAAPTITLTYPVDEEIITTGAPLVTYTVDRTQTHNRLIIWNTNGTRVVDTLQQSTSSTEVEVPGGVLAAGDYTAQLEVWTSDGLHAWVSFSFTVEYERPPMVQNATITAEHSSIYDEGALGIAEQRPNVRVEWDPVPVEQVSDDAFEGYRAIAMGSDGLHWSWVIHDRNETSFVDTRTITDDYQYYVVYVAKVNDGADTVQSVPALLEQAVELKYTTLRSESPDAPAVTLHYWEDRREQADPDVRSVQGWEPIPITFQGPKDDRQFEGRFEVFDHPTGVYSARDIIAETHGLKRPISLGDQVYKPRHVFYTDPLGNHAICAITMFEERHQYTRSHAVFDIDLQEVARESPQTVVIDTEGAVNVTNGYPEE